jgi:lipoate-protein ligase A
MKQAEYKVPGGKLLVAETEVEDGVLTSVKVMGDFFMHPEEAINDLEEALNGKETVKIDEIVAGFFGEKEITLFGVSEGDFAHVLKLTLES